MRVKLLLVVLLLGTNAYHLTERPLPARGEAMVVADSEYGKVAGRLIEGAEREVRILAFEMKTYENYPDSGTNRLIDGLVEARERGVDVKVVTDEYLNRYGDGASEIVRLLRRNGIDARLDGPDRTLHAKVLIVDGEWVLVGSTNWTHYSFTRNREVNVLVRSPGLAAEMEDYFREVYQ